MKTTTLVALFLLAVAPFGLAQGTYTQIDYPGAISTSANGINSAGDIVGIYNGADYIGHGFLLSNGVYTTIDAPDVPGAGATGINDVGQIVGGNGGNNSESYLYDRQSQTFTTIDFPDYSCLMTHASGINNAGIVAGFIDCKVGIDRGFEWRNGSFFVVEGPPYQSLLLNSINSVGIAVGFYGSFHNVLYENGKFRDINLPVLNPIASGINDVGAIVGTYKPSRLSDGQGFLYQGGTFQEIAFPGSEFTDANGINNSGVVTGDYYSTSDNTRHGFTWTPDARR